MITVQYNMRKENGKVWTGFGLSTDQWWALVNKVMSKITVFWDVLPCILADRHQGIILQEMHHCKIPQIVLKNLQDP
jgi:hypothetical protein